MNAVFADTSALLALLDAMDQNHAGAERAFATWPARFARVDFVCSRRNIRARWPAAGLDAVRSFRADFAPLIDVVWVDEALHDAGLDLCRTAHRAARSPSGKRASMRAGQWWHAQGLVLSELGIT